MPFEDDLAMAGETSGPSPGGARAAGLDGNDDRYGAPIEDRQRIVTVGDVLTLESMREARVLGGGSGLSRELTGALIIEVPEVSTWLRGGELLLSAGYPWRNTPDDLPSLIASLDDVGANGVGFKLGRYLKAVPDTAVAIADERGFPLLAIPSHVPYREIIEPLYEWLLHRRFEQPDRLDDLHTLSRFSLDDRAREKLVRGLARSVARRVTLIDLVDEQVVSATPNGAVSCTTFSEAAPSFRELVATVSEERLPRSPSVVEIGTRLLLAAGLVVGHEFHGAILVDIDEPNGSSSSIRFEVTRGAEVASFLLLRRLAWMEGRREAAQLLFDSLTGDDITERAAEQHARVLGLRLRPYVTVLVIGPAKGKLPGPERDRIRRSVRLALAQVRHAVIEDCDGNRLFVAADTADPHTAQFTQSLMAELQRLPSSIANQLIIAVGTPRTGVAGLKQTRSEAVLAYATAVVTARRGVVNFDDLGAERLLSQIPQPELAQGYVSSLLGPLVTQPELLRTLELYLGHGGNKVATAAAIPLHRSSLIYRLNKLEAILGRGLDDPQFCHELWLALRLQRLIDASS